MQRINYDQSFVAWPESTDKKASRPNFCRLFDVSVAQSTLTIINETSSIISNESNKTSKSLKSILSYYKSAISLTKQLIPQKKKDKIKGEEGKTEKIEKTDKKDKKASTKDNDKSIKSVILKKIFSTIELSNDISEFCLDTIKILNENKIVQMGYAACRLDKDFVPIRKDHVKMTEKVSSYVCVAMKGRCFIGNLEKVKDWWSADPLLSREKLTEKRLACISALLKAYNTALNCLVYFSKGTRYEASVDKVETTSTDWITPITKGISLFKLLPNLKKWWYMEGSLAERNPKKCQKHRFNCLEAGLTATSISIDLIALQMKTNKYWSRSLAMIQSGTAILSAGLGIVRIYRTYEESPALELPSIAKDGPETK